jgi:hypothetical protein
MSTCEKCWSDASRGDQFSVAEEYERLLKERHESPCTPEQQAGPAAKKCAHCDRFTLHQYTGICTLCGRNELAAIRDASYVCADCGACVDSCPECPGCGSKSYQPKTLDAKGAK